MNSSSFLLYLFDGSLSWCSTFCSFKKCGYSKKCFARAVKGIRVEANLLGSKSSIGLNRIGYSGNFAADFGY
jgi:hypothetical protein